MNDWTLPTGGTSDIYSTFTPDSCIGNPYSIHPLTRGRQSPRSGNNMCGFYTYGFGGLQVYREYLQVELLVPLTIGNDYYAEIYVSAAETSKYVTNNIGMYFSPEFIDLPDQTDNLPFIPQIKSTDVIEDTTNWVKVSGRFTATTNARYLIIGNFSDNINTYLKIQDKNSLSISAYYFIDDMSVKYTCRSNDTSLSICKGETVTLASTNNIVQWALASAPDSIISTSPQLDVSPQTTTVYVATYNCGETSLFEVLVDVVTTFSLGKDTSICTGETIIFDVTAPHATYKWQDGSEDPVYSVSKTGSYSVHIANGCGNFQDEIFISVHTVPALSFVTDTTICENEIITVDASAAGGNYKWKDGSTNPIYIAHDKGAYAVTIENSCGTFNREINLKSCCEEFILPNLITPNTDGKNETFDIGCYGNGDHELNIYNKWGALIYNNKSYRNTWDGSGVTDGIYYFVLTFNNKKIHNGWVQVLR